QHNGVTVPDTVYDYTYDAGTSIHAKQPATHQLGRLASATSPTSAVYFGYDAYGRVAAQATRGEFGAIFVETARYDADGALTELGMVLPDSDAAVEKMQYEYDSARRLKRAYHIDQARVVHEIYRVTPGGIDAFGRVRHAQFGFGTPLQYSADYADTGRRLLRQVSLVAANGDRRTMAFVASDP